MRHFLLIVAALATALVAPSAKAQTAGQQQVQEIINQIKKKGGIKLSATTIEDAIDAAQYGLQQISSINVVTAISEDAANTFIAAQLARNVNGMRTGRLTLQDQTIEGLL